MFLQFVLNKRIAFTYVQANVHKQMYERQKGEKPDLTFPLRISHLVSEVQFSTYLPSLKTINKNEKLSPSRRKGVEL